MTDKLLLPHDFVGRGYQRRYMSYHDDGGLRSVCVWHRRAGKDLTALNQTAKQAIQRRGLYWHCLPTYSQAKKAIWNGFTSDGKRIMDRVFPAHVITKRREQELMIELVNGSMVQLVGADSIDTLVGAGPVGVTFSEFALTRPTAWDLVRPMLAENGGWASFIFTPRGNNHAKKLYDVARNTKGWYSDLRTVHDTGLSYASSQDPYTMLNAEGLLAELRDSGMEESMVRQEYLCDFTAANVGSIWGDLMEIAEREGKCESFGHETDGIFTSWDLGLTDATAIWFWRLRDGGVDFVDYYEAHGKPLSHFFDELETREQRQNFKFVKHWLPHDAAQRTLQTGMSVFDQFVERIGAANVAIGPRLSVIDGIQAGRWLLQQDTRFNFARCKQGIEVLKQYHYKYDADKRVFGSTPEHDFSSHGSDAFRYAACVVRFSEILMRKPTPAPAPTVKTLNYGFSLDELYEIHSREPKKERV